MPDPEHRAIVAEYATVCGGIAEAGGQKSCSHLGGGNAGVLLKITIHSRIGE